MNETRKKAIKIIAAGLTFIGSVSSAQTLLWSEEFNYTSAPDSDVWSYDTGDWGWGNAELQNYTDSTNNVWVDGSNLVITARRSNDYFSSGRIQTQNKLTFKYGTIEARIQTPDLADGLWPAFWTLGNNFYNPATPWPDCGEIDIMEMGIYSAIADNKVNERTGSHFHWDNGGYANYGLTKDMPSPINDTFVIYRMEWTPTSISTYINGQWIVTMNTADIPEFNAPHFFILNMAVGGQYTGIVDASGITADFPAEYKVDWIRIYDNGDTVLGGTSQETPSAPGTNLLVNAGFESGTAGWSFSYNGAASSAHARTGDHSLLIDSAGAAAWSSPNAYQSFSASPGDVFHLQGYMLTPSTIPDGSFGLFKIEFRDGGGAKLVPDSVAIGTLQSSLDYPGAESTPHLDSGSAPGAWIFSQVQVEAPAGTAEVGFYLLNVNQSGRQIHFDDIQAALVGDLVPFGLSALMKGSNIQMNFSSQIGYSYQVAYKTNLMDEVWTSMGTIIGDGTTNTVSYPMNGPVIFYKVSVP